MKNFVSVSTGAARYQDISLNPQKLAGMCAKLKCCLNYEVDNYIEASKKIPSREVVLQTIDGDYYLFKTDILAGLVTYSTDKRMAANLETITGKRALEIIEMNKRGEKPDTLSDSDTPKEEPKQIDLLAGESLTRFDKAKKKKNKNKPRQQKPQGEKQNRQQNAPQQGKETGKANRDIQQKPANANQQKNRQPRPQQQKPQQPRAQQPRAQQQKSQQPRPQQYNNAPRRKPNRNNDRQNNRKDQENKEA